MDGCTADGICLFACRPTGDPERVCTGAFRSQGRGNQDILPIRGGLEPTAQHPGLQGSILRPDGPAAGTSLGARGGEGQIRAPLRVLPRVWRAPAPAPCNSAHCPLWAHHIVISPIQLRQSGISGQSLWICPLYILESTSPRPLQPFALSHTASSHCFQPNPTEAKWPIRAKPKDPPLPTWHVLICTSGSVVRGLFVSWEPCQLTIFLAQKAFFK